MIERPCSNGSSSSAGDALAPRVQVNVSPSTPSVSASCAEAKPPSGSAQLAEQVVERLLDDLAVALVAGDEPGVQVRRRRAARCRRASSRSAGRASARRPSSGGSRRRAGRRSRRRPSRRASSSPSRALASPPRRSRNSSVERVRELRRAARSRRTRGSKLRAQRRARAAASSAVGERLGRRPRARAERATASTSCAAPARRRRRAGRATPSAIAVEHLRGSSASRAAARAGSRCRRRTARPSGVRNTVIGQPPWPVIALHGLHVDRVEVGPLLAVDLDVDEVLVHQRRGRRRPRTTRAPSRGTSGRRRSRSRAGSACPRRARARAPPRPTGTSRPGCRRAGGGTGWSRPARRFIPRACHALAYSVDASLPERHRHLRLQDIEGSTRAPEAARRALRRRSFASTGGSMRETLREARRRRDRHAGRRVLLRLRARARRGRGGGRGAARPRAHDWPDGARSGCGWASTPASRRSASEGYLGLDVVRAARLCTAGQGRPRPALRDDPRARSARRCPRASRSSRLGERAAEGHRRAQRVFELEIDGAAPPRSRR